MNNPLHLPKPLKGRPSKVTLYNLCEYIKSLEKSRQQREAKLQIEIEIMLVNKFKSLEDKIQKQIDDRILGLETWLQKIEVRL
jgi:hypothetical protein